jgi:IMP dehydrogenase
MASLGAARRRKSKEATQSDSEDDLNDYVAEGVEAMVPYKGTVIDILVQITGGIRSGLSYCGGHDIKQMQNNAEFIKMSRAGFAESQPHDVDVV